MVVYVILDTIAYEGSSIHSIYNTKEKARAALKEIAERDNSSWEKKSDDYYVSYDTYFLEIEEHDVK